MQVHKLNCLYFMLNAAYIFFNPKCFALVRGYSAEKNISQGVDNPKKVENFSVFCPYWPNRGNAPTCNTSKQETRKMEMRRRLDLPGLLRGEHLRPGEEVEALLQGEVSGSDRLAQGAGVLLVLQLLGAHQDVLLQALVVLPHQLQLRVFRELQKVLCRGVRGWLRTRTTLCDTSDWTNKTQGVPQGSILGPLVFIWPFMLPLAQIMDPDSWPRLLEPWFAASPVGEPLQLVHRLLPSQRSLTWLHRRSNNSLHIKNETVPLSSSLCSLLLESSRAM